MFERFTDDARQAVVLAQEEAKALRHGWIGTEHLLLGVAGRPDSPGARVLARLGLEAETIREDVVRFIGAGGDFDDRDEEALRSLGIDLDEVRRAVEDSFGPGALERRVPPRKPRGRCDRPWEAGYLPFTPRSKKSLELALRWAVALRSTSIGTEHLLLGLAADRDGVAARILRLHGIETGEIRTAVEDDPGHSGTAS
jgi:ATP-dependent Clp protease ATP-binding subunit ClpA